ncbi:hypothetical protein [Methanocella paludicola]|nr:hypothetical protein [Methanocella paludicola]
MPIRAGLAYEPAASAAGRVGCKPGPDISHERSARRSTRNAE